MNIEEAFKHYDVTGDIEPLVDIFGDENLVHSLLGIVPVGCNNCMRYSKCEIRDYLGDCHFDAHKCKRFKIRYNIHRDKKNHLLDGRRRIRNLVTYFHRLWNLRWPSTS